MLYTTYDFNLGCFPLTIHLSQRSTPNYRGNYVCSALRSIAPFVTRTKRILLPFNRLGVVSQVLLPIVYQTFVSLSTDFGNPFLKFCDFFSVVNQISAIPKPLRKPNRQLKYKKVTFYRFGQLIEPLSRKNVTLLQNLETFRRPTNIILSFCLQGIWVYNNSILLYLCFIDIFFYDCIIFICFGVFIKKNKKQP